MPVILAFASGLVVHLAIFVHGEWDLAASAIFRSYCLLFGVVAGAKWQLQHQSLAFAVETTLAMVFAHLVALFCSMITYRLFFSNVRHIPGPLNLKLSKLGHTIAMSQMQNCKYLHQLHKKYGDVVRTGPNEVTLFGVEAYHKLHGPNSQCRRAQYYDILHPMVSLDTARDPSVHAQKRKIWEQAFSMKALARLEPIVYGEAAEFVRQMEKREGQSIDIVQWLEFYTFDLMGKFGLTIDFGTMGMGAIHPILGLYHMAHVRLGPLAATPWIRHLLMGIPGIERMKYYRMFMDWADAELDRNIKSVDEDRTDVIGLVIADAKRNGGVKANWNFVLGDFVLVMAAGSDPMRQVLASLLLYLVRQPEHLEKLRHELELINVNDYKALQHLEHLNACIYETLRLHPAVPSAGNRMAPKGGLTIGNVFIPEGTTVVAPQYSLLRDSRSFVEAETWIPERFSSRPDLILHKDAYVPWSIGKMSCLGKNLSLMEIRVALALLLPKFDFALDTGEDGRQMEDQALDFFTTTPGPLRMLLANRSRD